MLHDAKSIRPFIGAKDFKTSRNFYRDLGFTESVLSADMSVFKVGQLAFYLQNADVKDWIDNTMIFLEVDDVKRYWDELQVLNLPEKYPGAKLTPIRIMDWGRECFLHDPSGILWHFGQFN
jgi:catechol 2,3-dioxygenase-like lactoylglutathione lyase family enzyme